jgi:hypothetical protein
MKSDEVRCACKGHHFEVDLLNLKYDLEFPSSFVCNGCNLYPWRLKKNVKKTEKNQS